MSLADIRADILDVIEDLPDIGVVYDYERYTNDWARFVDLFSDTIDGIKQIRGWMIGYSGTPESEQAQFDDGTSPVLRQSRWVIRGYLGLDDSRETEKTFQDLVEDVLDALDDDHTDLHDPADYFHVTPATAPIVEARVFGSVLCHYCEIVLTITEFETS